MKKTLLCLLLPALALMPLSLPAAEKTAEKPAEKAAATATPKLLVKVDGTPITEMHYLFFRAQKGEDAGGTDQNAQMAILNELINTAIVANEAKQLKLDQHPEIQAAVDIARMTILAEAVFQDYLKKHPVTDEMIKAAYEKRYAKKAGKEYKARHILLESEDDAKAVIKALNEGADFIALAKEKSTGPSGPNGGDLGWFSAKQMVKPFADATRAMKKGSYTKEPVKTQFGWHVILLEDVRDAKPPKLEDVQESLRRELSRASVIAYLNELRDKAKVEFNEPEDKKTATAEK